MASSSSDDRQSISKDPPPPPVAGTNPPPVYPPQAMGYPHGHGYPPAMGYPPAPHPGYPPAPGTYPPYNAYAYAQAPPAAYYTNNPQPFRPEPVRAGFIRGIVSALILLVVLMTLSSIITWIVLRPEIPTFRVDSLAVANFNISKANYSGNWESNVTVQNPNQKLNLNFERIQSFVDFKDNTLAMSFVEPFFLDVEKSGQMRVKLTSSSPDDPGNWAQTEEKMGRERATGFVSFNLRFFVWTTFRSGTWWTRRVLMRVFCEDLKLAFAGPAANNAVNTRDGFPKNCAVLM